jgi:hypothetical protein
MEDSFSNVIQLSPPMAMVAEDAGDRDRDDGVDVCG